MQYSEVFWKIDSIFEYIDWCKQFFSYVIVLF